MTLEIGQVWRRYGSPYGDVDMYQVVFVKGLNAIVVNCATLKQTVVYGQGQLDSFKLDCELMDMPPRLNKATLATIGY